MVLVKLTDDVVDFLVRENLLELLGKGVLNLRERMLPIKVSHDEVSWIGYQQRYFRVVQRIANVDAGQIVRLNWKRFDIAEFRIVHAVSSRRLEHKHSLLAHIEVFPCSINLVETGASDEQ